MTQPDDSAVDSPIRPRTFKLAVPADWTRLDVAEIRKKGHAGLPRKFAGSAAHWTDPVMDQFRSKLTEVVSTSVKFGAIEVYLYSRAIESKVMAASLIVTIAPAETRILCEDLELLAFQIRATASIGPDHPMPNCSIVELGAGQALMVESRRTVRNDGTDLPTLEVQYHVPIPHVQGFLLLSFSTPNVSLAVPMGELFDAVARTLRWVA